MELIKQFIAEMAGILLLGTAFSLAFFIGELLDYKKMGKSDFMKRIAIAFMWLIVSVGLLSLSIHFNEIKP